MPFSLKRMHSIAAILFFALASLSFAQSTPPSANSHPAYVQLRNVGLSQEAVAVSNLEFRRDAAKFVLRSGTLCFVTPVAGKVTGAVFEGEGTISLEPPTQVEAKSLGYLTKGREFVESFDRLVLRFTDDSYNELKKAGSAASTTCDSGLLRDSQDTMRKKLKYNLTARILQDVLRQGPGGLFVAFVHGKQFDGKLLYTIDPQGAPDVTPEEVELTTYAENKSGIWAAFPMSGEYRKRLGAGAEPGSNFHIDHQQIDTAIEGSAKLTGKATATIVPLRTGARVLHFNLFPTLRLQSVVGADGKPLSFIQEDKLEDSDPYVIFPEPLSAEQKYTITFEYGGKEAVYKVDQGYYYPIARDNWYPSNPDAGFADFTSYDLTFRIPKYMKMAATGSLVRETTEGSENVTVWKSDVPQAAAGFEFGEMKREEIKMTSPDLLLEVYANEENRGGTHWGGTTVSNMKRSLVEAQHAVNLYTEYFGPMPYKRLSLTEQASCSFGQAWPGLIWLPACAMLDKSLLDFNDVMNRGYWSVVTPHEVAHQWWGHLIGFRSYRDQWMSEGFADFSASLFLQSAYSEDGGKKYKKFWDDERKFLTEKNKEGYRAIDVGPLTLGYRLNNSRAGFNIARELIYPKGAYVVHMLRMMMWDSNTRDQNFKEMLRDLTRSYGGRTATTEDFKAVSERHMNADMKMIGGGKMDWFFDQYVYGTALPTYTFAPSIDKNANGVWQLHCKLTQSGVPDNFRMLVPIYLELSGGRVLMLGRARLIGNSSFEQIIPLNGLNEQPVRASINYYDDVLALTN